MSIIVNFQNYLGFFQTVKELKIQKIQSKLYCVFSLQAVKSCEDRPNTKSTEEQSVHNVLLPEWETGNMCGTGVLVLIPFKFWILCHYPDSEFILLCLHTQSIIASIYKGKKILSKGTRPID